MEKIGRYEIIEELGRGTMGAVFKARDPNIGRIVAIKVILTANLSAEELTIYKQRFYREAQAAGRMLHPGIIAIHDIQEDGKGQPYLVMEYAEGHSLHKLLKPNPLGKLPDRFPLNKTLDLAGQVADALDYAHSHGVVHRDIKPSNIIVTPEGRAKIADFGIARLEGTEATHTSSITGTPAYMSPEQFKGGAIDKRSDIFSLGAMLYWMTTGHKPFPGESLSQVSFMVVYKEPIPPLEHDPALPPDVAAVLARCLAKNPDDRYPMAKQLVADLHSIAEGKPLSDRAHAAREHLEETIVKAPRPMVAATADVHAKSPAPPAAAPPAAPKAVVAKAAGPRVPAKPASTAPASRPSAAGLWARLTAGHSKGLSAALGGILVVLIGIAAITMMRRDAPAQSPVDQAAAAPSGDAAAAPAEGGATPPAAEGETPPAAAAASGGATAGASQPPHPVSEGAGAAPAPHKAGGARRPDAPAPGTTQSAAPPEQKVAAASSAPAPSGGPAPPPPPVSAPEASKPEPASTKPAMTPAATSAPAPAAPGATAKLEIECKHNFKQATIEILEGTRVLYAGELVGKSGMFGRESGTLKHSIALRPGKRTLTVRVNSAEAKYSDEKQIEGDFADNVTLRLEIGFPRGGGIGIGGRRMNLSWKK